jgi:hypothetical protein
LSAKVGQLGQVLARTEENIKNETYQGDLTPPLTFLHRGLWIRSFSLHRDRFPTGRDSSQNFLPFAIEAYMLGCDWDGPLRVLHLVG